MGLISRFFALLLFFMLICCDRAHLTEPVVADAKANKQLQDNWWKPTADERLSWQWQLQGTIDTSYRVDVYNIDFETDQAVIDELKARGVRLICYFSAGTVEWFRDDARSFPASVIGEQYTGYEDEQWLNIAEIAAIAPVMQARLDRCASSGFDAVEADNVDAFNHEKTDTDGNVVERGTSFGITRAQSTEYVLWLAAQAHERGLGFGLKNAEALAPAVLSRVDWMLTENCFVDNWCEQAKVFVEANKPVFMTEYVQLLADFTPACRVARELGFSAIYQSVDLAGTNSYQRCE